MHYKSVRQATLPAPGDNVLIPGDKALTYVDLREHDDISGTGLNRLFSDLLNHIVANDSKSTRADDRLDNMCNMLLLKMDSDTNGKMLKTPKSLLTSRFARHRWKPQKESIQTLKGTWRNTLSSSKTHQRKPSNSMMRRFMPSSTGFKASI